MRMVSRDAPTKATDSEDPGRTSPSSDPEIKCAQQGGPIARERQCRGGNIADDGLMIAAVPGWQIPPAPRHPGAATLAEPDTAS